LDMLSSVLTKNPYYTWRQADLSFVQSYEATIRGLEDEKTKSMEDHKRCYIIPGVALDPVMLFLFFRQNFCGSTFCHVLRQEVAAFESRTSFFRKF